MENKCPNGYITRDAYVRKTSSGKMIKVKESCIKAQSESGKKSKSSNERKLKKQSREHKLARQIHGVPKCKAGESFREGYVRNGLVVPPTCVKNRKTSRKTSKKTSRKASIKRSSSKQKIVLEHGTLGNFGYHDVKNLTKIQRHKALKNAVEHLKPLTIARKLNIVATLQRNVDEEAAGIFKEDYDWFVNQPEYINRSK